MTFQAEGFTQEGLFNTPYNKGNKPAKIKVVCRRLHKKRCRFIVLQTASFNWEKPLGLRRSECSCGHTISVSHFHEVQRLDHLFQALARPEADVGGLDPVGGQLLVVIKPLAIQSEEKGAKRAQPHRPSVAQLHLDDLDQGAEGAHHLAVVEVRHFADQVRQLFEADIVASF